MLSLGLGLEGVSLLTGDDMSLLSPRYALMFLGLAYAYAFVLSLAALTIEEFSFHRYYRWRDLGTALIAAVLENVGYRQLTAWWRVQGTWDALRGTAHICGTMTRQGFGDTAAARAALPAQRSLAAAEQRADSTG